MEGWQAYVAGVVWVLRAEGHEIAGADLVLSSDVPIGAGLSSSAALECATLATLADLNDLLIEPLDRAKLARRCENEFVGAPTGLMDQAASTLCVEGHALFFDCRSFDFRQVPVGLAEAGLEMLVLDTNTPHALVDSEYADRRASCEEAAALLGVPALRDVDRPRRRPGGAAGRGDAAAGPPRGHRERPGAGGRRAPHRRPACRAGAAVGRLPRLDARRLRDHGADRGPGRRGGKEAGALGARMTGGGFGGCIIALVPAGEAERVADEIYRRFADAGYRTPKHFVAVPSGGAHRLR